jgi:hypothetical protein
MLGPESFYLALEETPGDPVSLLALADWHEEQGNDSAAACLRWTVEQKRYPFLYRRGSLHMVSHDWHDGWFWWGVENERYGGDWGHPGHCLLPRALWRHLRHSFDYAPSVFKEYATVQAAYEALLDAWPLLLPFEIHPRRRERPS